MKIGIIVHSSTGNTLHVAQRLQQRLSAAGHSALVERVSAMNDEESDVQKIRISQKTDTNMYDVLIFGAPVRGFSLSPVMQAFLYDIGSLSNKKTACFLTQFFPSPRMGGNRALKQMVDICCSKGTAPYGTGIVNWANAAKREKVIQSVIDKLCSIE